MRLECNIWKVKGTSNDVFEMTKRAVKVVDGQRPTGYGKFFMLVLLCDHTTCSSLLSGETTSGDKFKVCRIARLTEGRVTE